MNPRFEQQYELECLKERARNSSRGYRGYSSGYSSGKTYESLDDFLDSYDK